MDKACKYYFDYCDVFHHYKRTLGSVLGEGAKLEAILLEKGSWTSSEKERHHKALITRKLIHSDFNSIHGTNRHWYQLITKKDFPLIEYIDKSLDFSRNIQ